MRTRPTVLLTVVVVAGVLATPVASADEPPEDGVITESTTLTTDHEGGIVIGADGITLNCAGHRVVGEDIEDSIGISLDERTGVTIKNCVIDGFGWGVGLAGSHGNTIKNNSVYSSLVGDGFVVVESSDNVFKGNVAIASSGAEAAGFVIVGSSGNRFSSNRVEDHFFGFVASEIEGDDGFVGSHDNVYRNNVVSGGVLGIYLTGEEEGDEVRATRGNIVTHNRVTGTQTGFALNYMTDSTVTGNKAAHNDVGFYLSDFSNHNTMTRNRATDNSAGIVLYRYATENLVANNHILSNELGIGAFNHSTDNIIRQNRIRNNVEGFRADGWSSDNQVRENSFCHNTESDWWNSGNSPTEYIDNKVCGPGR